MEAYAPYTVDWRFLPEELLVLKDWIRHHIVRLNNAAARSPTFSRVWADTIGKRTLADVLRARVLFVHVPKTGGTSISKIVYGRNLPHFTAEFFDAVFGDALAGTPSFAVLRHPMLRLMSCYRFTISGGTEIMASNRFERRRLGGLESFPAFVDFLYGCRDRLQSLPSTFHPQASFVLDKKSTVMVDRLFALDETGRLPAELHRFLGVGDIPRLNATHPAELTITPDVNAKIRELYKVDFELFDLLSQAGGQAQMRGRVISGI